MNDPTTGPAASASRVRQRPRVGALVERYGALIVLVLLVAVFSILLPDTFFTYTNLTTLLTTRDILAIVAIGALVPLAAGEFDLSIGFTLGFSAMVTAVLTSELGWPTILAIGVGVATGAVVGLVNGLLVVRVRISAFIATLGMGSVLAGLTIWISGGTVIYQNIPDDLVAIGRTRILSQPLPVYFMFASIIIFTYVMGRTPFGRYLYAIGGGRETARLAGLNTARLTIAAFVVSGLMAGIAGVLETASLGSAHPNVGAQFLLPAFAALFLGATTIQPGRFNVLGTVVALFLLAVGIAGLQQLGAPLWVGPVFNGLALLVAVGLAVTRGSQPRT